MTPTLLGRWQSRLFLLGTMGTAVSFGFSLLYSSIAPLILLAIVLFLGLIWDWFYDQLQQRRWDRDWPPTFQLIAGLLEGAVVFSLVLIVQLPASPSIVQFWVHYSTVWITTFLMSQSIMRLIFPRWRFNGGVWL